ncbi:hypothetical protein [Micromonospora sp. LOL_023]|uniref:hypothetical protein n=1 Tax=Micromonospora sp. LOL_023 TaxID=3345418 RepID=UPI003A8392E9
MYVLNSHLKPYQRDGPAQIRVRVRPAVAGSAVCIIRTLSERMASFLMVVTADGVISAEEIPVDDPRVSRNARHSLEQPEGGSPTCGNCVSITI